MLMAPTLFALDKNILLVIAVGRRTPNFKRAIHFDLCSIFFATVCTFPPRNQVLLVLKKQLKLMMFQN